jgi:sodium-dependent dicarboxylate transporter 2/3/5
MLPVATPPNAIVFGSGYVTIPQMARSGFGLNLVGIVVTVAVTYLLVMPIFDIVIGELPAWVQAVNK